MQGSVGGKEEGPFLQLNAKERITKKIFIIIY